MTITATEWRVCAPIHAMNGCSFDVILSSLGIDRQSAIIALSRLLAIGYVEVSRADGVLKFTLTKEGKDAYYNWLGF